MDRRHCLLRPGWSWIAIVGCGALLAGCQTLPPSLVPCPLPVAEQVTRVQELVPLGTPRDEAVALLRKAGIGGTFGSANSIFYCETWTQSEDERWHLDVQLMFNESGEVYAYRTEPVSPVVGHDDLELAKAPKPPKHVASGPKQSIVDPFAE